ncbi:MAG: iron-containing alcohol dehydrogenase [Spirochaetales bacterium]|nr:iron-containing alcohol dehydrogenase [Spirochaetales bacterium]
MLSSFTFSSPTRIVFGEGSVDALGAELVALGASRVLLVTGSSHTIGSEGFRRARASAAAAGVALEVFSGVTSDPPVPIIEACSAAIAASRVDAVVAYGGGSPIDCAKAACLHAADARLPGAAHPEASWGDYVHGRVRAERTGPPLVAIPTTAGSGSETSSAAVTTDLVARRKIGMSDGRFFPRLALVDPSLHASMPPALTAATGMDALTHAVESLVSRNASPVSAAIALESARLVGANLARAFEDGADREARSGMALGAAIAGMAFSQSGLGMVHGFAHPVGALAGAAHGLANAVMLPYVMEACIEAVPEPYARLAAAFGLVPKGDADADARAALGFVRALSATLLIPRRLRDAGVDRELLPAILADALSYRNRAASPHAFTDAELHALLESAW